MHAGIDLQFQQDRFKELRSGILDGAIRSIKCGHQESAVRL